MTHQEIKSFINTYIVANGVGAITGARLNTILNALADYYGFDSVVVTTLPAGSDATVNVQGKTLELGIPKGADGIDGQDAVNPFKGWFTTDNIPTEGQAGDYCNVSDTSTTPPTVTIYRWNTTTNQFEDTGEVPDTATGETFASGETLQEVAIDDSHLADPENTADQTKPVLADAKDVLQLQAKLDGFTANETKASPITDYKADGNSGYYKPSSSGWTAEWNANNNFRSTKIELPNGCKSIRFFGYNKYFSDVKPLIVFMDEYSNIISFKEYYDPNIVTEGKLELNMVVPYNCKFVVCLYNAWGASSASHIFKEEEFYFYAEVGESVVDRLYKGSQKKLSAVQISDFQLLSNCYVNTLGVITSYNGVSTKYLPVRKGDTFIIKATPTVGYDAGGSYNVVSGGFSHYAPYITYQLVDVFAGVVYSNNSTQQDGYTPSSLEFRATAHLDGYFIVYYVADGVSLEIYKETIEDEQDGLFDTYVEENIVYQNNPFAINTLTKGSKYYAFNPNVRYKTIYRTVAGQDYDSIEFLAYNMVVLGSSGDANTVMAGNSVKHIMEDLGEVPAGTAWIRLNYAEGVRYYSGSIDQGMAALMKPLSDKIELPTNKFSYFVSKVKSTPLAVDSNGSTTSPIVQNEVWSAWGAKFPTAHKMRGKKTPLVAFFHGTLGLVTSEVLGCAIPYGDLVPKLVDAGFAVFDINGKGVSFDIDGYDGVVRGTLQRHWGCPTAVATAKKAYEVLTELFNCRKGMAVGGISMGGDLLESYLNTHYNDAVVAFGCAPTNLGALVRSASFNSGVDTAVAWDSVGGDYSNVVGFSKLVHPNIVDDDDYIKRWESMVYSEMYPAPNGSTENPDVPQKFVASWPVETIIWHGTMDLSVNICQSKLLVEAARNAGCNVKLRVCEGYGHPLMDFYDEIVDWLKTKLMS